MTKPLVPYDIAFAKVRIDTDVDAEGWGFCTPLNYPGDIERGLCGQTSPENQVHAQVFAAVPAASYSEITQPYAAALRMVRDAIEELFGPAANLESEEAVLLRGPEPHHDAEAIIAALQNIRATALSEVGR